MGPCLFTSVRSLLTLLLVCASGLGGMAVLTGAGTADRPARALTPQQSAVVLAERLESALLAVSQDVSIVAESLAFHGADPAAIDGLLAKWQQLHPDYADALFAERAGRVQATARGRIVGADLSASPWFAKALVGGIVGDAAEGSRAGVRVPRNVIVAAPVGAQPSLGIVAVQLTPEWADTLVAAVRRTLPEAGRGLSVTVLNGTGRALHRSGPEPRGPEFTASVGDLERGGPGWLVTVRSPEAQAGAAGLPLLMLAAVMGLTGALGWGLGGRLTRALGEAEALCRQEGARPSMTRPPTRDLLRLTAALRAAIDRSEGYERLLREKRSALARSQDRIRAIRALSGSTCWEIDRSTGQIVWTDGDSTAAGSMPERACALDDVLAYLRPADRAALESALDAVAADRGSVRDVIVATRLGTERTAGRRLAFRVATLGTPETARVYALSREIAGHALAGSASGPAPSGRAAQGDEPGRRFADAEIQDLDDGLTAAMTALGALLRDRTEAVEVRRLAAVALRGVERGAALTRRMTGRDRAGQTGPTVDLSAALDDVVALIRETVPPGMIVAVSREADLPPVRCSDRQLERILLDLVDDLVVLAPADATASLRVAAEPRDGLPGVRIDLSAACSFGDGSGLRAASGRLAALGGYVALAGRPPGSTVSLWLPAGEPEPARVAPGQPRAVLLVEADPLLRTALAGALADLGHRVTAVAGAVQARMVLAGRRDLDVLVCGHDSPPDGLQLAAHPRLRMVAIGGSDRLPGGVTALHKPFGIAELAAAIDGGARALKEAA